MPPFPANPPLRVAHRGMPRLARENTLGSFALALEAGADGIELDVHATADGIVVVHHDPTLAGGHEIAAHSLRELRRQEPAVGEPVATLAEVCALVHDRAELFVEIKGSGIEGEVLAVMDRHDGRYAIHSFDHALVARAHALAPAVRFGILVEGEEDAGPAALASAMTRTGALDVWPHFPLVQPAVVAAVHGAGGRVIPWTVNTSEEATRLASLGVDALCGDDVRLFPRR